MVMARLRMAQTVSDAVKFVEQGRILSQCAVMMTSKSGVQPNGWERGQLGERAGNEEA